MMKQSSIDPKEDILLTTCRQCEVYPEPTDQEDINMTNNEDNFFPVTTNQEDVNITKTDTTINEEDSLSGLIKQEPIDTEEMSAENCCGVPSGTRGARGSVPGPCLVSAGLVWVNGAPVCDPDNPFAIPGT